MPLAVTLSGLYFGAQSTGAFKFVKDLVLEVPRFPLTCRDALFSASSPVAGAALLRLSVLDAHFFRRIQIPPRVRRRHQSPSLTKLVIPNGIANMQPQAAIFLYNFEAMRAEPA